MGPHLSFEALQATHCRSPSALKDCINSIPNLIHIPFEGEATKDPCKSLQALCKKQKVHAQGVQPPSKLLIPIRYDAVPFRMMEQKNTLARTPTHTYACLRFVQDGEEKVQILLQYGQSCRGVMCIAHTIWFVESSWASHVDIHMHTLAPPPPIGNRHMRTCLFAYLPTTNSRHQIHTKATRPNPYSPVTLRH